MLRLLSTARRQSGFIMLDLLLALGCMMIIAMFFIPILTHITKMDQDIKQGLVADEKLSGLAYRFIEDNAAYRNEPIVLESFSYEWEAERIDDKVLACLTWETNRNRTERMCTYVPLYEE